MQNRRNPRKAVKAAPSLKDDIRKNPLFKIPRNFDQDEIRTSITHLAYLHDAGATASTLLTIVTNTLGGITGGTVSSKLATEGRQFSSYRVLGYTMKIRFASRDDADNVVAVYHTSVINATFSTGTSVAGLFGTLANKWGWVQMLAAVRTNTGSPTVVDYTKRVIIADLVGNESPLNDDAYAGALSTSGTNSADPATLTYCYINCGPFTGSYTAADAPALLITFTQDVILYNRRF